MKRIVRVKDIPSSEHSIQSVKYAPLRWDPASLDDDMEISQKQIERNATTFTAYSTLYALRLLEITGVKERAFQAGYEAGQGAAIKEMQDTVDSELELHKTRRKALEGLASLKDTILSQAEGDIIQLVIEIARKLVCRELKQHPDAIVAVIKKAIKASRIEEEITIKIHPDDYTILEQYMSELKESLGRIGRDNVSVRIEEAPELAPGGCVIETDTNLVDMSLETRMESVFSMLDTDPTQLTST